MRWIPAAGYLPDWAFPAWLEICHESWASGFRYGNWPMSVPASVVEIVFAGAEYDAL